MHTSSKAFLLPLRPILVAAGPALIGFLTGCDTERATIEGKVRERGGSIESGYTLTSPDAFADECPPVPGATAAIIVKDSSKERVLISTVSKEDGSFTLKFPRKLPGGGSSVSHGRWT